MLQLQTEYQREKTRQKVLHLDRYHMVNYLLGGFTDPFAVKFKRKVYIENKKLELR